MIDRLRPLVFAALVVCFYCPLPARLVGAEGDLPAALIKAWEKREGQAAKVEIKFKGTVTYVAPVENDGVLIDVREPLPRAGVLIYDGTKLRLEDAGQWPWNRNDRRKFAIWNDTTRWYWTEDKGHTSGTISNIMIKTKDFEGYLQPLFWTVRPTRSMLGQWGAIHKLSVDEATLPKVDGKCYRLTEEPIGLGSHVTWWIHQESATVRQVEILFKKSRTIRSLEYGRKDEPWVPSGWSEVKYSPDGEVETRSEFQIESISFPREIEPDTFDWKLKPGMIFVDTTVRPPKVFEIDEQGNRVPAKGK
jgi:hypothetical protein